MRIDCESRHATERAQQRRALYVSASRETKGGIFIINECSSRSADLCTQGRLPTKRITNPDQQVSHVTFLALLSRTYDDILYKLQRRW